MAKITITKAQLLKQMNKEYDDFYDNEGASGYILSQVFDELMKENPKFKKLVQDFVVYRKDPITSDREASAFLVACEKYDLLSPFGQYTLKSQSVSTPKKTIGKKTCCKCVNRKRK